MHFKKLILVFILLFLQASGCPDKEIFLGGVKRVDEALFSPCDPYNEGKPHSCLVFATLFKKDLLIYDASAREMVLSPMQYFPLRVNVGPSTGILTRVYGAPQNFPFILALDNTEKTLSAVPVFKFNNSPSFSGVVSSKLNRIAYKMAAFLADPKHVVLILSYPNQKEIELRLLEATTGLLLAESLNVPVGISPSHIAINNNRAVISDEGLTATNLYILDLSNIVNNIKSKTNPTLTPVVVGMATDRIYLESRDFGLGLRPYLLALEARGAKVILLDLTNSNILSLDLKDYPIAAYLPDKASNSCCNNKSNWFMVADLKGVLHYILVNTKAQTLEKNSSIELSLSKNLDLNNIRIAKLVGGNVISDSSIKKTSDCSRKIFIINNYAEDPISGREVEAQGYLCEGKESVATLGNKAN